MSLILIVKLFIDWMYVMIPCKHCGQVELESTRLHTNVKNDRVVTVYSCMMCGDEYVARTNLNGELIDIKSGYTSLDSRRANLENWKR